VEDGETEADGDRWTNEADEIPKIYLQSREIDGETEADGEIEDLRC
jgi:hypothetical protein